MSSPSALSFIPSSAAALIDDHSSSIPARLAIGCCAEAAASAREVTERKHSPLKRAQEKLTAARRFWAKARETGAAASEMALIVEAGIAARDAVAAAEKTVSNALTKKLRLDRAMSLKGYYTREAAHAVADALTARGLYAEKHLAMNALAAVVGAEISLQEASPEHILAAWMRLDPTR